MWKLSFVVLVAVGGCLEPSLVVCANGLACPVGSRCDETHVTCVTPEQLVVCGGAGDGAACMTASLSGGCFDGVCLPRGCGNRIAESGEMCDDGNQVSDDGCSSDCTSTEVCGNGAVDPGEPCDDGNLMSRDGCDSRCQLEQAAWSVIAVAPANLDGRKTAYDSARGRLVVVSKDGDTWEWDGKRWTVVSSAILPAAVFYDPDRQQVEMIGSAALDQPARLYAWSDGHWLLASSGDGPSRSVAVAAYDVNRHRVLAVEAPPEVGSVFEDPITTWTIDATGSWTPLPGDGPSVSSEAVAAFDPGADQLLIEDANVEWVYDANEWTSSTTSFSTGGSIAFDPDRGHLVVIDGETRVMYQRIAAAWQELASEPAPCRNNREDGSPLPMPLYHDGTSATLELVESSYSKVCSWDGSWTESHPPVPVGLIGATYDPITRNFVFLSSGPSDNPGQLTEVWRLADAGWHRLETPLAPSGRAGARAVYSLGRGATVLYRLLRGECAPPEPPCTGDDDTWTFDGAAWVPIAVPVPFTSFFGSLVATYDPAHGRVVLAIDGTLWSLGDTEYAWLKIDSESLPGLAVQVAWDARNETFMAISLFQGLAPFELRDGRWVAMELFPSIFNPRNAFSGLLALVSDQRTGGVIAVDLGEGFAWERIGSSWLRLPPEPVRFSSFSLGAEYNPVDGSVWMAGPARGGTMVAILTRTSATPLETCHAGEDTDGDGLVYCDDPDCYWTCPGHRVRW
jgi:cysteine-rich repeat protein